MAGNISDMPRRREQVRRRNLAAVLLAMLCLVVVGAHILPSEGVHVTDTASSRVPLHHATEIHEGELVSHDVITVRIRQELAAAPIYLPATMATAALFGGLLTLMMLRGAVFSRAPNNLGRRRLMTLGINRN